MAQAIPPLHESVELPVATPPAGIADAIEERFQALLRHALCGDPAAIRLRLAYLIRALAGRQGQTCPAQPSLS